MKYRFTKVLVSKEPPETVEQQIERQVCKHGNKNRLSEIIGKWPGDEDFDQLLKMLTR